MFLLILESIGTQELILIGLVALIFLGPRKLPEIARKVGKMMADLRSTTNEFRSTWEREVDFESEANALRIDSIEQEAAANIADRNSLPESLGPADAPAIRSIDKEKFDQLAQAAETGNVPGDVGPSDRDADAAEDADTNEIDERDELSDKRSWL